MSLRSRVLSVVVAICGVFMFLRDARAELRQFECSLSNDYVAFVLRESSEMGTVGARSYIVDFQENGPTIRLPPTYYAPDWGDVEDILFEYIDVTRAHGRLSLRIRRAAGPSYVESIAVVERACWDAAKNFLAGRNIAVHITERMAP